MTQRPDDLGAAEAADYLATNDEYPTPEELRKSVKNFLQIFAGIVLFAIAIGLLSYAGYQPPPEFHG